MRWDVTYYDGATGRGTEATLGLEAGLQDLVLTSRDADAPRRREIPRATVRLDVPLGSSARVLWLDDGGKLEFASGAELDALEGALGMKERPWIVRLEQSGKWALGIFAFVVLFVFVGFRFVVPFAAADIAGRMNDDTRRAMGKQVLRGVDQFYTEPSNLPGLERERIRREFADYVARVEPSAPEYTLIFRASRIGPNALALPGDTILLTDELVALYDSHDPVHAVLLHELGHVHHRHALRAGLQRVAFSLLVTFVIGDVIDFGSVAGSLPSLLVESGFSRAFEREADAYALDAAAVNGLGVQALHVAFTRLLEEFGTQDMGWLGSHPGLDERVARVEARMAGTEE